MGNVFRCELIMRYPNCDTELREQESQAFVFDRREQGVSNIISVILDVRIR
jgi:hypothetical protein